MTTKDKAKARETHRRWREKNRERLLAQRRAVYARNPEKHREQSRRFHRNMTEEQRANKRAHDKAWVAKDPARRIANAERSRAWAKNNPERSAALHRKQYEANKAAFMARSAIWKKNNPAKRKENRHKLRIAQYGLTPDEYNKMFQAQGGLCAACHQPEIVMVKGKPRNLSVDHDHETGAVRSLLCTVCNGVIGFTEESAQLLRAMAEYLERSAS